MKKNIAIAVVAFWCIWSLPIGAMRSHSLPAGLKSAIENAKLKNVVLKTKEGTTQALPFYQASLLGLLKDVLSDAPRGTPIPLRFSADTFNEILQNLRQCAQAVYGVADLNNTESIAGITQLSLEERKKCAENVAKALSAVQYSQAKLCATIESFNAAHYLQIPEVIVWQSKEIASMLTSVTALHLFHQNDSALISCLSDKRINRDFKREIYAYMPEPTDWYCQDRITPNGWVDRGFFSLDESQVVTGFDERETKIFQFNGSEWILQFVVPYASSVSKASFSSSGNKVLIVFCDGSVKILSRSESSWIHEDISQSDDCIMSAMFSSDEKRVITKSLVKGCLQLFALQESRWIKQREVECSSVGLSSASAAFSSDRNKIVVRRHLDRKVCIYAWNGSEWIQQEIATNDDAVNSFACAPDGSKVAIASGNEEAARVKIYAWKNGLWVQESVIDHDGLVNAIEFSPDSNSVVTASWDHSAKLYTRKDGAWSQECLIAHDGIVKSACFSSCGTKVVTASCDKTAKIYAWNGTQWLEQTIIGHGGIVHRASFTSNDRNVVTSSVDNNNHNKSKIWQPIPVKTCDQALLIKFLEWSKNQTSLQQIQPNEIVTAAWSSYDEKDKKIISEQYKELLPAAMRNIS